MARKTAKTEKGQPDKELRSRPPAPNQRRLPLFNLHDEDFEELLLDIADREPEIVRAELKRSTGFAQFGVDVEGFSDEQRPVLVISCKCYKRIQPHDLATWGKDFLDHVGGHWKDKGVKRFVLAVSVELNDDGLNDQIALETAKFKAAGLRYEVWGLKKLTDKLRPLPHSIVKFFPAGWLEMIGAGPGLVATTALPPSGTSTANSAATSSVTQSLGGVADAVRQRLGNATANRLDSALQQLREGIVKPLRSLVDELKADRLSWDSLAPEVKGKFLRAQGSLAVRDNDLEAARTSYAEADAYSPPPDRTPSVLVARLEAGPAAALALVEAPLTPSEASIRTGLLLELERPAEAVAVLDQWPEISATDDAYEPTRLRSIAQLWNNKSAAVECIRAVEGLARRQFAVQWAAAVVRFNFALSDKVDPVLSTYPNPVPQGLVRDTEDARSALDEAERIFDALSSTVDTADQAADLCVWRLACLVLNPLRFDDAGKYAAILLQGTNPHPGAVVWATSAGLVFDQDDVLKTLDARLKSGDGDASHAVAIAYVTLTRGAKSRALASLKRHRKLFSEESELKLLDYWIGLISGTGGDSQTEKFNAALGELRGKGNAGELVAMLDTGGLDADMQLAAFENLALNSKWFEINERRPALLAFRTSHASELAIRAAFGLHLYRDVAALAVEQAGTFNGSRLPSSLGILVARSQLSLGDARLALRALQEMRDGDNSNELAFEDALIRLRIGDLAGAAAVVRGRQAPASNPEALLRIAAELRYEDPELARGLLAGVSFADLSQNLLPQALALVNELGLRTAASVIMPRLFGPDAAPSSGIIVMNSVEEAIEFARDHAARRERADAELTAKWLGAEIPIHLVFDREAAELAWFFHRPFSKRPTLLRDGTLEGKPFLLRGGTRRVNSKGSERLVIDVTALLLANELGLIDHLEHAWSNIQLPNETPELLRTIETELNQQFGPVSEEAHDVRRRLEAGHFSPTTDRVRQLVIEPEGDDDPSHVTFADLLAHLVARGMDGDLASEALIALSLAPAQEPKAMEHPLKLAIRPGDLVTLRRVNVLDRLIADVELTVDEPTRLTWLAGFDAHIEGRALADKIGSLRQHVADKANAGIWNFLPVGADSRDGLENLGAAGRLFFSLLRAAENEPCEIWAEDRTVSLAGKLGHATIIDVVTVLDRLSKRMSEPQRVEATRRVRRAGYGFTLPSAEAIVDALLAAPMEGAILAESDELAAIRRDFAVQFANSRHLIDKSSSVTPGEPELLFLSRLLGLAGKVFAALWSRANVSDQRLDIAATWVARHLRVEQARFLPRENRTVASREAVLYLQHLSIVSSMFNVTGSSFRQARERRSKLLEWVLGAIIEPAFEIHPTFRGRLIDYLADALASLGKLDSKYPDVTAQMLAGVIQDYLNAFPDDWRIDLQRHEKLSALVGLREIEIVSLGKDFTFDASDFYVAVGEAYASGKSTVPMMGGKRNATITVIPDAVPAPDKPVAFMVKAGGKTANFADDRLELEREDIELRQQALKRHPSWFDQAAPQLDATTRQIAEQPDAKVRRQLLADAQAKSMAWRLQALQDQIQVKGSSDKVLLLPPHPDSVRQFLRLSSDIDVNAPGWLDRPFANLRHELGPIGALARLGAVPFEMGASIDGAVVEAVTELGVEEALRFAGPSPMVRTALFAALLKSRTQELNLGGLTQSWSDYGVLFQSLLRLAFRSATRREEWQAIAEPERSILLWAHANAVLDILAGQGAAPKQAAKIIDGFVKERMDRVYARSKFALGRLVDPLGATWRETAGVAIAYAIRDRATELTEAQRSDLRAVVTRQVGTDWLLELELWAPSTTTEPPGCWLGVDPALPLAAAGVGGLPPPINERNPQAMVLLLEQRIVDEAVSEEDSGYWPILWMIGLHGLDAATRDRVSKLIGSPGRLPDFTAQEGRVWGGALRYRAELYGVGKDIESFKQMFVAAALEARAQHRGERVSELSTNTPAVGTFHRLCEPIWQYSTASSPSLLGCATTFADLVMVLSETWPESLLGCLALLEVIAAQLDIEPAGPLWDAIHLLRSR